VAVSDAEIAQTIRALLGARDPGKTICPSDAARALGGEDFRPLMAPVRRVARAMPDVEITQKGRVVDPDTAPRGAIRLGLVQRG
jgi:hypothetical protein